MKALTLTAEWAPKPGYDLTDSERELRRPRNANMTWKGPRIELGDVPDPALKPDQAHAGGGGGWHLRLGHAHVRGGR